MLQDEYETELTGDRATVAAAMSDVIDGLLAGSVRVGDDADAIAVEIPEELTLEVELETNGDERSLELELEWTAKNGESDVTDAGDVVAALEDSAESSPESDGERKTAAEDEAVEVLPVGAGEPTQSLARFELYQDRAKEWRWRLRHRNGNIIATSSEGYTRKHNARKGLNSVVQNAPGAVVGEKSE
jgi:amphi-Trp domain-containing protein